MSIFNSDPQFSLISATSVFDLFGPVKPHLLRRDKEAPLGINPEPSRRAQAEGKPGPSVQEVEGLNWSSYMSSKDLWLRHSRQGIDRRRILQIGDLS